MNIAALISSSGTLPDQPAPALPLDAAVAGEFKGILQALVAGTEAQPPQAPATEAAPNWLGILLKLFDQDPQLFETPDPTGEALNTVEGETTVSLTELMTVLQPLVGQSDAESQPAVPALAAGHPADAITADSDALADEANVAALVQLAQLIAPTTPAASPETSAPTSPHPASSTAPTTTAIPANPGAIDLPQTAQQLPVEGQAEPTGNKAAASFSLPEAKTLAPAAPQSQPAPQPHASAVPQPPLAQPAPAVPVAPADPAAEPVLTSQPQAAPPLSAAQPQPRPEFAVAQPQPAAEAVDPPSARPQPAVEQPAVQTGAAGLAAAPAVQTANTAAAPAAAPHPPEIPALQQIVESVKVIRQQGETEVRLQLRPESLGQVTVQLHMSGSDVSVRLLADTAHAQSVIQENLPQLKAAFAAQGLQVQSLNIDLGHNASAFNTPGREPGYGQFNGNGYQPARQQFSDEQPANWSRSGLLNSLYSIDFQA